MDVHHIHKTIVESMTEVVYVRDRDMNILYINPAAEKLVGQSLQQAKGKKCFELFGDEEARCRERCTVEKVIASGDPIVRHEHRIIAGSGLMHEVRSSIFPINGQGTVDGAVVIMHDIRRLEEGWAASKAKLEAVLASIPGAVLISDAAGNFIDFNEVFATFHRFESKEECPRTFTEYSMFFDVFLPSGELAALDQWAVPRALRGETVMNAEYIFRRKDTDEAWVGSYCLAPICDEDGGIVGSVVIGHDITEQKRIQDNLSTALQHLTEHMENSPLAIIEFDPQLRITRWTDEAVKVFGWAPEEIIGKPLTEIRLVHDDDRGLVEKEAAALVSGKRPRSIHANRNYRKDGSVIDCEWYNSAIYDSEGNMVSVLSRVLDVTRRKRAEEQMRESRQRLQRVSDNAKVGLTRCSRDWLYLSANPAYAEIAGKPVDEIVGRPIVEVMGELAVETIRPHVERVLRGEQVTYEAKVPFAATGNRYLQVSYTPDFDATGQIVGWVACVTDITERKQTELELERTFDTLAEAQKIAHLGSFEYVADTQTTVWSEEEYRIYGLDPTGPSPTYDVMLRKCIHPDDAKLLHETFTKAMESGSAYELEHRILRPDGSVRWVYNLGSLCFNEQGEFVRLIGTTLDVTDRKKAEETVKKSEERLRLAQEAAGAGTWEWDLRKNESFWSDELWALLGLEHGSCEPSYESWLETVHPDDRREVDRLLQETISAGTELDFEYRSTDPKGSTRWVLGRGRPIRDERGEVVRYIGINMDITDRKRAEEELKRSESMLRAVLDQMPSGVTVRDARTGDLVLYNHRSHEIMGALVEKPDQFYLYRPLHSDGTPYRNEELPVSRSMSNGELVESEEIQMERSDGSRITLSISSAPVCDEEGRTILGVGIFHDITERKQAEEALRKAHDELEDKVALRTSELKNAVETLKKRVTELNCLYGISRLIDVPGISLEEILQRTADSLPYAMQYPSNACARIVLEDGQFESEDFEDSTSKLSCDIVADGKSVGRFDICYSEPKPDFVQVGFLDEERKLLRAICERLGHVIGRHQIQRLIQESEEKYRLIFSKERDAIILIDSETLRLIDANEAATQLWGYPREELQGMPAVDLSNEPGLSGPSVIAMGRGDEDFVPLRWHRKKDGTVFPVEVSGAAVTLKGRSLICAIVRNISERMKLQELAVQTARLKSIADLSSGVAHHFNNLLQMVMGGASLALDDVESGDLTEAKNYLKKMFTVAQRGARMVERLQTFANTRVGGAERDFASLDLSDIARNAAEVSKPLWITEGEKRGINVDLQLVLIKGCWMQGREDEILEVLDNLLKNAGEALPHGGIIEVKTFKEADEVVLTVRDTGTGISQQDIPHVFEPFWTTKGFEIGRGMGLAVVHGLVTLHGGTISVESKSGVGSTFTVRFPLAHEPAKMVEQAAPTAIVRHLTILVVDDETYVAELIQRICTKAGHRVFMTLSGKEALAIFEKENVDLVICDLGMPGMNGWEVGRAIRAICDERGITKPPFVLLTGWGSQQLEKENIEMSGTDKVIAKPISPAALASTIQEIAERFNIEPRGTQGAG